MRYAWVILAAALFLIGPSIAAAQLTSLRVGTNSPASTEAVPSASPRTPVFLNRTNWTLK